LEGLVYELEFFGCIVYSLVCTCTYVRGCSDFDISWENGGFQGGNGYKLDQRHIYKKCSSFFLKPILVHLALLKVVKSQL
jgi:hypothetical protein